MKHTHGRYASYWNVIHNSVGHAWQGRYFSCPLDRPHLWEALRYTELNPVRAQLVAEAHAWVWSSAAAHCATVQADPFLSTDCGRIIGPTLAGGSILRQGKRKQSWRRSANARIRAGLWAQRSSSMLWKSRWTDDWFLRRGQTGQTAPGYQDNQISISAYDEILGQKFSRQLPNGWRTSRPERVKEFVFNRLGSLARARSSLRSIELGSRL